MIEYRCQVIRKFLPRRNFPLSCRSSLHRLFSSKVNDRWTIKTCDNVLLCEYFLLVYFGILLQKIIWFLIYLLWSKDRILVYQIRQRRSHLCSLMQWTILECCFLHWVMFSSFVIVVLLFFQFLFIDFPKFAFCRVNKIAW